MEQVAFAERRLGCFAQKGPGSWAGRAVSPGRQYSAAEKA
jgi:hypothetical protein